MNQQKVTILLTTCDAYSDAWEPFFRLWKQNWPDCPYPFVLNSETKTFSTDLFSVSCIPGGTGLPWSKRLKKCLRLIKTEYVLLCLEDYFLQEPVKTEIFNAALKTMDERPGLGVIQFAIDIHARYDENTIVNQYFSPVPKAPKDQTNGRIYCVLSLYRTKYLSKLLVPTESPWEFELFGSIRSQYYHNDVFRENESHSRCFTYYIEPKYGYAISRGKWLPKNKELFDRYGIEVDFSRLGLVSETEYEALLEHYYGKREKGPKEHHTPVKKLTMPLTAPKQFWTTLCNYLRKTKIKYKKRIKLQMPFLP